MLSLRVRKERIRFCILEPIPARKRYRLVTRERSFLSIEKLKFYETGSKIKFIHTGYLILELQVPDLDLRAILYMGTMGCRANMKEIS